MEDLTGQIFGKWKVLEFAGKASWKCECQCENHTIKNVRAYSLKSGDSKSCGCGRVTSQLNNLVGQTFGRWKVIEYKKNSKWLCECQCKNKTRKILAGRDLKSGGTKSCGCLKHEKADIVGNWYGTTEVIGYNKENYKWICKCSCGELAEVLKYDLEKVDTHNVGINQNIKI